MLFLALTFSGYKGAFMYIDDYEWCQSTSPREIEVQHKDGLNSVQYCLLEASKS